MEPQINYGTSHDPDVKIYGTQDSGGKKFLKIAASFVLLAVLLLAGYFFVYPAMTTEKVRGEFMDLAIVPQKDGSRKLWVITDGSTKIPVKKKTSSNYSNTTGVDCINCQLSTYIYDASGEKVIKKIKTELTGAISRLFLLYSNGKVWIISPEYYDTEPRIEVYDSETMERVMDTKGFTDKFPLLSSGLSALSFNEKEKTLVLKTKDAHEKIIYSIESDKLYNNPEEYEADKKDAKEIRTTVILCKESSSAQRKKLIKVTGPDGMLELRKFSLENATVEENSKPSPDSLITVPVCDKVFIEGIIYNQDEDCAVIIHQEQAGKNSKRLVTCIDLKTGGEKWTITQDKIMEMFKLDASKIQSVDRLYSNDSFKLRHAGNLVVMGLKNIGLIELDYETGKILRTMDI